MFPCSAPFQSRLKNHDILSFGRVVGALSLNFTTKPTYIDMHIDALKQQNYIY